MGRTSLKVMPLLFTQNWKWDVINYTMVVSVPANRETDELEINFLPKLLSIILTQTWETSQFSE